MAAKRTRAERAGISREQVLDAALVFADREGVSALSMRKLGAELGVEAMTLYHYVPNKDALLDGMVERVMSQADAGFGDGPWRLALGDYARALRGALSAHPGALPLIATRPAVTPRTLQTAERGLKLLVDSGFELGTALDALNALTLFVVAHANSEARTTPVNEAGDAGSVDFLKTLDPAEFPLIMRAAQTGAGTDDSARFEFAIAAMIHGFAAAAGLSAS
ncbi:TetR/AcrR family transcriptional regulator C-terminal domain-containing protein [Nocardia seriolae]|uniref:Tetracycline repressor protein class H n=1 Tax=Nocardia seriolae TaxID=37332 RepID=A0ABC8AMR0_9NOCA|nr:TetR/AcrR family transcriptional regulator C-terminal domain-containing protein [Nocardia seriolae]APA95485.1 Tetracycline repressor protein class H [Nocardia seriolae]MTJ66373.1 TetR family transcriptional regulator [Nocardia seriolae]MTJ76588.1 TetR family transcriptional regulator [Nocardia seriolae]MTJ85721.1 TetR family transcriptional regulator [Nocardia seriolae]MTK29719.1 TetR family transcriptional regulator [Nocardia seriolae]